MIWPARTMIPGALLILTLSTIANTEARVPRIWDDTT